MSRLSSLVCLCALLVVGSFEAQGTVITYDFESVALSTTTPFTYTVAGLSAQFTNPTGAGVFQIDSSLSFDNMAGHYLYDTGSAPNGIIPLRIGFSSWISSISLNFATSDAGTPTPLTLDALLGGATVGSTSVAGTRVGTFPTGTISFNGAIFDSIVLSDPNVAAFAIDNVTVDSVPEPATFSLVAGALGIILWRTKRNIRAR